MSDEIKSLADGMRELADRLRRSRWADDVRADADALQKHIWRLLLPLECDISKGPHIDIEPVWYGTWLDRRVWTTGPLQWRRVETTVPKRDIPDADRRRIIDLRRALRVIEEAILGNIKPPADTEPGTVAELVAVADDLSLVTRSASTPHNLPDQGWLLPPVSLKELAGAMNTTPEKAKTLLAPYGLQNYPADNRQSWTVNRTGMPDSMRQKLDGK